MRPLVAVRRAASFDPLFFTRHALFWPIARAARSLAHYRDFPPADALVAVFGDGSPPVRFVPAPPRRRRRSPLDAGALYDARITVDHVVPTRAGCWHDLMNALVWGTFPRAKQSLHARQYRAIAERLEPGARLLPPARTRELDALALLDEGGVAVVTPEPQAIDAALRAGGGEALRPFVASGAVHVVVFGHAIYESLLFGVPPAIVGAIILSRDRSEGDILRAADEALARTIDDRGSLQGPNELTRIDLETAAARAAPTA